MTLVVMVWVSNSLVRAAISYRLEVGGKGGPPSPGRIASILRWAARGSSSGAGPLQNMSVSVGLFDCVYSPVLAEVGVGAKPESARHHRGVEWRSEEVFWQFGHRS